MLWVIICGTLITIWLLRTWMTNKRIKDNLPPSVPDQQFCVEKLHLEWHKLSEKYGDIFTVWQYRSPTVIVDSAALAEEVYKMAPNNNNKQTLKAISAGGKSLVMGDASDPEWKHLRQVTYGSLLKDLEILIHGEVESLISVFQDLDGNSVEPTEEICTTFACIISTLMFGEQLGRDHPDIKTMLELADEQSKLMTVGNGSLMDYFPWLEYLNITPTMKRIKRFHEKRDNLLDEYLQRYRSNSLSGGLIELLMKAEDGGLSDDQIKADFVEFLLGGIETTKTVSLGLILLLLHHQDEREKLHQEIDQIIGRSRSPKLMDQSAMPLLQAALLETLRFIVPFPIIVRANDKDIELYGFQIPANTQFYINAWSTCHDTDFWEKPDIWRPGRFLDDDNQLLPTSHPKRKRVELVFGSTNRVCPAKHFAKARLFLLFAAILQRFDLRPDPNDPLPLLHPSELKQAMTTVIPKFKVSFVQRY